jgi:hypothetical protein
MFEEGSAAFVVGYVPKDARRFSQISELLLCLGVGLRRTVEVLSTILQMLDFIYRASLTHL